jgi:hypothetical protein
MCRLEAVVHGRSVGLRFGDRLAEQPLYMFHGTLRAHIGLVARIAARIDLRVRFDRFDYFRSNMTECSTFSNLLKADCARR